MPGAAGVASGSRPDDLRTTLAVLVATPGPAGWAIAAFRVGDSTVRVRQHDTWEDVFDDSDDQGSANTVLALPDHRVPQVTYRDGVNAALLITDGIDVPMRRSPRLAAELAARWAEPRELAQFVADAMFIRADAFDDRTAVAAWFPEERR